VTLIREQPHIHARWSIFTYPGQNEPRPGHGTPWVKSGTIPAIPGRLASLSRLAVSTQVSSHRIITESSSNPRILGLPIMHTGRNANSKRKLKSSLESKHTYPEHCRFVKKSITFCCLLRSIYDLMNLCKNMIVLFTFCRQQCHVICACFGPVMGEIK